MDDEPTFKKCVQTHWKGYVIVILPFVFAFAMLIDNSQHLRCLYAIIAMFFCWVTNLYPFAITAMFPIAAFPLMNIMKSDVVCSVFFKESCVMFVIALMISLTMESTGLHTRIALHIMKIFGSSPRILHVALTVITFVLSMLVPNAVSVSLMYPVTAGILENLSSQGISKMYENDSPDVPKSKWMPSKTALCYYLTIAYTSSIGGSANIMGSSVNVVLMKLYKQKFPNDPEQICYGYYLLHAFPPMLVIVIIMWILLETTYMGLFRKNSPENAAAMLSFEDKLNAKSVVTEKLDEKGSMNFAETMTSIFIFLLIILIFLREPRFMMGWGDTIGGKESLNASVGTVIIFAIFSFPGSLAFIKCWDAQSSKEKAAALLTWKFVHGHFPWALIFVIGTGGALAEGSKASGLAMKIENFIAGLHGMPPYASLLVVILFMIFCANITVNTAVMSVLGPGILQLAVDSKTHPLFFILPAGLTCNMAFLMPPATAANALVASYGNIKISTMALAGFLLSLAAIIIIYLFAISWSAMLNPDLMELPMWAMKMEVTTTVAPEG